MTCRLVEEYIFTNQFCLADELFSLFTMASAAIMMAKFRSRIFSVQLFHGGINTCVHDIVTYHYDDVSNDF